MKTITFYSYKGGVGRSMALANIAWRMAGIGKRIGVVDLDLEAPGLSLISDFNPGPDEQPAKGLSGFLGRSPDEIAEDRARFVESRFSFAGPQDGRTLGIGRYCHWIESETFKYPGTIIFLPVGESAPDLAKYLEPDSDPDPIFSVKEEFANLGCEYLFVDSRTGLCATSGIASILYPDQVIMVLGLNSQNLQGTSDALGVFREQTGDIFYFLPSLVPHGEEELKQESFSKIKKVLKEHGLSEDRLLVDLSLPYHPQMAVEDRPMLVRGVSNFLAERYDLLTEVLIAQNEEDPLTRIAQAKERLRGDKPLDALRLIGSLYGRPPFDNDVGLLKLYGEACFKADFTVEAEVPLTRAMELEAQEDKAAGREGVPTIEAALLYNESLKKAGRDRSTRVSFLQRVKNRNSGDRMTI